MLASKASFIFFILKDNEGFFDAKLLYKSPFLPSPLSRFPLPYLSIVPLLSSSKYYNNTLSNINRIESVTFAFRHATRAGFSFCRYLLHIYIYLSNYLDCISIYLSIFINKMKMYWYIFFLILEKEDLPI